MAMTKPQVKYKKAPDAPRRFKSSYMFFSEKKHKEIRKELTERGGPEQIMTTLVAKLVSKAWKSQSPEERRKYEEMASRDKARYEVEKSTYTGPWKVPVSGKRASKHPDQPKRPCSAFFFYCAGKRTEVKAENPNARTSDISKILSRMWKDAPEAERREFIDKEFQLRAAYKVAIAEWRKKTKDRASAERKTREDDALRTAMSNCSAFNDKNGKTKIEHSTGTNQISKKENDMEVAPLSLEQAASPLSVSLTQSSKMEPPSLSSTEVSSISAKAPSPDSKFPEIPLPPTTYSQNMGAAMDPRYYTSTQYQPQQQYYDGYGRPSENAASYCPPLPYSCYQYNAIDDHCPPPHFFRRCHVPNLSNTFGLQYYAPDYTGIKRDNSMDCDYSNLESESVPPPVIGNNDIEDLGSLEPYPLDSLRPF